MTGLLFLTIATADYLARAAVLNASLRAAYGDEAKLAVLWVAELDAPVPADAFEFDLVRLGDLDTPTLWDMAFRYEKGAFSNALKPFFIRQMIRDKQPNTVIFLDADTLVYSQFDEVHELLESGASLVLTPHFDRPQARTREPYELDLLRQGVTNGGFVALAANPDSEAFLSWWATHLLTECRYEIDQGLYGDQHWLDLAPALFNGVHVLRHRGYNAAYWNFPDRSPRSEEGRWLIGPDPLRFYHFSQWRIERGETVEACMERLFCGGDRDLAYLLGDYLERWTKARVALPAELGAQSYPFGAFNDGTPIPKIVRDAYGGSNPPNSWTLDQLFGQGLAPFLETSSKVPAFEGIEMPELYVHIWNSRSDLRHLDLSTYEGQLGFMRWAVAHAGVDYGLAEQLLEPAQRALATRAEEDRLIEEARSEATQAYAKVRKGGANLSELVNPAARLVDLLNHRLGLPQATPSDTPGLFESILSIRSAAQTLADYHSIQNYFDELSVHIEYFGDKSKTLSKEIVAFATVAEKVALESDSILNVCNILTDLLHRHPDLRRVETRPKA